jgi:hypothetical protein
MPEATAGKPRPIRAVHHTTHRFDPDDNGISFPAFVTLGISDRSATGTPIDFPRLHGEMLADEDANGLLHAAHFF